jgi:hypothetical protein
VCAFRNAHPAIRDGQSIRDPQSSIRNAPRAPVLLVRRIAPARSGTKGSSIAVDGPSDRRDRLAAPRFHAIAKARLHGDHVGPDDRDSRPPALRMTVDRQSPYSAIRNLQIVNESAIRNPQSAILPSPLAAATVSRRRDFHAIAKARLHGDHVEPDDPDSPPPALRMKIESPMTNLQ